MCKHWPIVCLLVFSGTVPAQESPGLGESVSPDELAALDFVILPNGSGLPPGAGTAATGTMVYQKNCMACHGEGGKGGVNDALAGGRGSLTSDQPKKTIGSFWPYATTIFDYVRRSMPLPTPGILTNDELYSVTAYLLYINDVIELNTEISAQTLPKVKMPNRDNFVWDYSPQK
jgi:cytochrome c